MLVSKVKAYCFIDIYKPSKIITDHYIFEGGKEGGGGGVGQLPKKKFLHSTSKEKKSCTVGQGKKIEQAFLFVGSYEKLVCLLN